MSSFQTSGFSAINPVSRSEHSCESRSITFTPSDFSHSTPPEKFLLSPTTSVRIPNCRINPLQYQQGASVVTIILSRYDLCRPALRNASVSPCTDGSSCCTLLFRPEASSLPSPSNIAAPIGTPPSPRPIRASAIATSSIARYFAKSITTLLKDQP